LVIGAAMPTPPPQPRSTVGFDGRLGLWLLLFAAIALLGLAVWALSRRHRNESPSENE
jgi:hypothetical protein